jgi:hypothetical protein
VFIDRTAESSYRPHLLSLCSPGHLHFIPCCHLRVRDLITLGYLVPTFGAHHILSSKTTLIMPPRRVSQCLHPDECLPQASTQNNSPIHPNPLHHHRRPRAPSLRRYPRSLATPTNQQHVHHRRKLQPK